MPPLISSTRMSSTVSLRQGRLALRHSKSKESLSFADKERSLLRCATMNAITARRMAKTRQGNIACVSHQPPAPAQCPPKVLRSLTFMHLLLYAYIQFQRLTLRRLQVRFSLDNCWNLHGQLRPRRGGEARLGRRWRRCASRQKPGSTRNRLAKEYQGVRDGGRGVTSGVHLRRADHAPWWRAASSCITALHAQDSEERPDAEPERQRAAI